VFHARGPRGVIAIIVLRSEWLQPEAATIERVRHEEVTGHNVVRHP
jgi:hypothetical protein